MKDAFIRVMDRLRRLREAEIFGAIFIGKCHNNGRCHHFENVDRKQYIERSEQKFFWFVPALVTFWGTLVTNE